MFGKRHRIMSESSNTYMWLTGQKYISLPCSRKGEEELTEVTFADETLTAERFLLTAQYEYEIHSCSNDSI